tara:strand:- start:3992 stop:4540 length:549 start_codon:yes stop_codon:yes gene_type:complete
MNYYDEMKDLLRKSRLISEQQSKVVTDLSDEPVNIDVDSEEEIEIETTPQEDKSETYRVSGGLVTLHGKDKQDLELNTDEKVSFQETMDDFVDQVSDLSDFGTLHIYPNNVEWSGKVIDFDLEFFYSIGENNGVYVNGDMIKLDDNLVELIGKLTSYYEQFKSKWAKVLSSRKKTTNVSNEE